MKKFAAYSVHAYAFVALGDCSEQRYDRYTILLQWVQPWNAPWLRGPNRSGLRANRPDRPERLLISAGEGVAHAEHVIAPQRRVAEGILVLLVEEVQDTAREEQATRNVVAGGHVEAGVAGISRQP